MPITLCFYHKHRSLSLPGQLEPSLCHLSQVSHDDIKDTTLGLLRLVADGKVTLNLSRQDHDNSMSQNPWNEELHEAHLSSQS